MQEAFEKAGLEFIPENGGGAGIRFRKRKSADPILDAPQKEPIFLMGVGVAEGKRTQTRAP